MSTPYDQFKVGGSYTDTGEMYGYQLSHVGCDGSTGWTTVDGFLGDTPLDHLIQLADRHWAERHGAPLPLIPQGKYRFRREPPKFVRLSEFGDGWLLLGREIDLVPGTDATVLRYGDAEDKTVRVSRIVAERVVQHRASSYDGPGKTRFVLAEFEPLVEE